MLKDMTIDQSLEIIENFCEANRVDALTGIELMVKHWVQLNNSERTAVRVFMTETKRVDK